jgi:glycerophosphoryl diester phosphodiesterase
MPLVTKIAAHRGGWGRLENSVQAMESAIAVGADMVEFDVRKTADGYLIIRHDALLHGQPVAHLTLAEIRAALGDQTPPLLETIVAVCKGRIFMDVEIKSLGYEAGTVAAIRRRCAVDEFFVTSFLDQVIVNVKRVDPKVRCGLLLGGNRLSDLAPWRRVSRCGADFIGPHFSLAQSGLTRRAWRRGIPVVVWTVNSERALRRSLGRSGIEALVTDTPAVALCIREHLAIKRRLGGRHDRGLTG